MDWINFNKYKLSCFYSPFGYFVILWLSVCSVPNTPFTLRIGSEFRDGFIGPN